MPRRPLEEDWKVMGADERVMWRFGGERVVWEAAVRKAGG
jgi:hypothetical protein